MTVAREDARRADERTLRDPKRERLRGDYVAVAWAAENVGSAAKQLVMLLAGDTPEARGERIPTQLEDAHADLGRAMIRLRLEEGTQSLSQQGLVPDCARLTAISSVQRSNSVP